MAIPELLSNLFIRSVIRFIHFHIGLDFDSVQVLMKCIKQKIQELLRIMLVVALKLYELK